MDSAKPQSNTTSGPAAGRQDFWIRFREAALNSLLRIDPHHVLNPRPSGEGGGSLDPTYPARELIRIINRFKALAIDSTGAHVDYSRLASSPAYLDFKRRQTIRLHRFDPASLDTPERQLPFWINLYNVLVIDAVIRFDVKKSVTEKLGLLRFFRQAAYRIGGRRVTLEDIEQGILRGNRGNPGIPGAHFLSDDPRRRWIVSRVDPRIHFALNCASRSCPPVGVYSPDHIGTQLDSAAQNFLQHETQIQPERNELRISKIFQWYAVDFGGREGTVDFLLQHLPAGEERAWLAENQGRVGIRFNKYDWRLNM